ncbi:hypothetical protein JX266_013381 [Neoarthrinium moseri]|nr:hypothetical protein JX266_013381 [Neoarthrinium moseri]
MIRQLVVLAALVSTTFAVSCRCVVTDRNLSASGVARFCAEKGGQINTEVGLCTNLAEPWTAADCEALGIAGGEPSCV